MLQTLAKQGYLFVKSILATLKYKKQFNFYNLNSEKAKKNLGLFSDLTIK